MLKFLVDLFTDVIKDMIIKACIIEPILVAVIFDLSVDAGVAGASDSPTPCFG